MSGVSIDHLISVVVLLAAILLFIGLFNQTLSVGIDSQRNTTTAKVCSDLLDAILLNPRYPNKWYSNSIRVARSIITPISAQFLFFDASKFILRNANKLPKNKT